MKAAEVTPEELNEIKHFMQGAIGKPVKGTEYPQRDIRNQDNIPQGVQALYVDLVNGSAPRGYYGPYDGLVVYMAYDVQSASTYTDVIATAAMGVWDVLFWTPHEGRHQLKKRLEQRLRYLHLRAQNTERHEKKQRDRLCNKYGIPDGPSINYGGPTEYK